MTAFTDVQLEALTQIKKNRLTVVRAGPGSGKTRVFVEALRQHLIEWPHRRGGIAALSFTNVAHEVITQRLGAAPGPPHFVNTLDSFFWRFVVRPFGHLAGISRDGARLLPAPLDESFDQPTVKYGPEKWHNGTIFMLDFCGGTEAKPDIQHRTVKPSAGSHGRRFQVEGKFWTWAMRAKKEQWAKHGRATYSDSHYLASSLLNGRHGAAIAACLAEKFPLILVDEFQDTNWFLGRALVALMKCRSLRCAVVGDPDQAIYQFGGADRGLFDRVEQLDGASSVTLAESHRCSVRVAAVASAVARSGRAIRASRPHEGRAILLVHGQPRPSLDPVLARCEALLGRSRNSIVLARSRGTVRALSNAAADASSPWRSGNRLRLYRAVERFLDGDSAMGARLVERALGELLLDEDTVTIEVLRKHGIAGRAWRSACHMVLTEGARSVADETWNDWLTRLKGKCAAAGGVLGKTAPKLGRQFRLDESANVLIPSRGADSVTHDGVMTIHMAKGREHSDVIVYVPKPHATRAPCPSGEWWSDDASSEEREVAFVACSRASDALVLALHQESYDAIATTRPEFLAVFEVAHLDQPPPASSKKGKKAPGGSAI